MSRLRFRFGMRSLFVLMTIACVGLGWYVARQRQAAAIVAIHHAVLDVIEANIAAEPENTTFQLRPSLRQKTASFLKKTRRDPAEQRKKIGRIFGGGRFDSTAIRGEPLDIAQLLASSSVRAAAASIRKHHERGLRELGLHCSSSSTSSTGGDMKTTADASSMWQMNEHGLHVLIDVHVDTERKQADVRVIFLHNERLSLW